LVGFLAGMHTAVLFFPEEPSWMILIAALGTGLLGVFLSVILNRVAFALAGFFGVLYLLLILTDPLSETVSLALSLAGALAGGLLAALVMDRAIIIISSLVGAGAVTAGTGWNGSAAFTVFAGLTVCGIIFQSLHFGKGEKL